MKNKESPEMLRIRSKQELWNDFIVPGINGKTPRSTIRAQLLEAIRKEVFEQICWRTKTARPADAEHSPENEKIVASIAKETRKKWKALVQLCNERLATLNLIYEDDLAGLFDGENEADDEDEGYEFCEAEDSEEEEDTEEPREKHTC